MVSDFKFFKDNKNYGNPSDYDLIGFEFVGVSPLLYNPYTFSPVKRILLRDITNGNIVKGDEIYEGHPMWNYNN